MVLIGINGVVCYGIMKHGNGVNSVFCFEVFPFQMNMTCLIKSYCSCWSICVNKKSGVMNVQCFHVC